jgi:nitroreductase
MLAFRFKQLSLNFALQFITMYSREFQEIVTFRRSNRKFDPNVEIPDDVIRRSLERAVLSPNSSNMQLWEFYWLRS